MWNCVLDWSQLSFPRTLRYSVRFDPTRASLSFPLGISASRRSSIHRSKRQTSLPQTTTQRQGECDPDGLRVLARPTSTAWFTTTTTTDCHSSNNAGNHDRTLKRNAHNKKRRYNTPKTTNQKWITTNGFANSIQQTDAEAAILHLGEHVACELGLRFRASPPHSHQSNGAVERLHRTLFDQLRAVRLQ